MKVISNESKFKKYFIFIFKSASFLYLWWLSDCFVLLFVSYIIYIYMKFDLLCDKWNVFLPVLVMVKFWGVFSILSRSCFSKFVYGNDCKFQWQFLFFYNIANPFPYLINTIFSVLVYFSVFSVFVFFEKEIKRINIQKTGQHSRWYKHVGVF